MDNTPLGVWLVIALGSAIGGALRHLLSSEIGRLTGDAFPWGTLSVNILGSLAIGGCAAVLTSASPSGWTPIVRHAAITGVLGGFTTFSTFSMQTLLLLQRGEYLAAGANALGSVGLGLLACAAGYSLASGSRP